MPIYLVKSVEFCNFEVIKLASFTLNFSRFSHVQVKPYSFISGQKFACSLYVVSVNVNVSQIQRDRF